MTTNPEGVREATEYVARQLREAKAAIAARDVAAAAKATDRAEHAMNYVREVTRG